MMLIATIQFLSGVTVTMDSLPQFLSWEMTVRWLPALIGAGLLYWGINRIQSVLLLPIGLICILVLFYTVALALSLSLESLRESGFDFTSIPEGGVFDAMKRLSVSRIDGALSRRRDEIGA